MTAKPKQPRKPAIVRPCGPATPDIADIADDVQRRFPNIMAALHRSELDDDREEKCRQLARLGAAMGRVCR